MTINKINDICCELNLLGILQCYQSIAEESGKINASYSEYLEQVLLCELMIRNKRSQNMLLKLAGFPVPKTIESFNFNASNVDKMRIMELTNLNFIANKENIILIGSPGTGKTHLAISLAYLATQKRLKVKFFTLADLLLQLEASEAQNKLKIFFSKTIGHASLIVIDEIGYQKLNEKQADLLFQVVNKRYESGSIIITSNLTFSNWQEILNNNAGLTAAIVDRLIHHSHIININGQSYRMKERSALIPSQYNN